MRRIVVPFLSVAAACGSSSSGGRDLAMPPDMATLDPGVISTSDRSSGEAETHVAVAPNGYVAIAYIGLRKGGGSTNGYRFSKSLGDQLEPADALDSPSGRETSDPVLAADAQSNFYMTWVEFQRDMQGNPLDMHVLAARAPAGTTRFGAPVEVSDNPSGQEAYDKPWITIAHDGAPLITYARTSTGGILAARSQDGGASWTRAVIVEDMNFRNLVFPCAPSTGRRIYVTYHAGGGIGLRWSDDDGATWPDASKTAVAMMGEQPAFEDPTCAAEGDEVWISYGLSTAAFMPGQSAPLDAIRLAHSSDRGATIDWRVDAHDAAAATLTLHPYLIREPAGPLDLVYYAGASDGDVGGSFRRSRSTDGGKTWLPSTAVRSPIVFTSRRDSRQWLGDYVGLAYARGDLFTSFTTNSPAMTDIFHVAFYRATP